MGRETVKVLVVGQTPPPIHGQSIMIQQFLDGHYEGMVLCHVRLNFSRTVDEVGVFHVRKLLVLVKTVLDMLAGRLRSRAKILYYPPAGPTLNPVIRDIVILICTRWLFKYTVFHFHAAGLPEIVPRLPWVLKPLFKIAYRRPDLAIFTTESTASAGAMLQAKTVVVIPCGIPDKAQGHFLDRGDFNERVPQILYMGLLCEGKGLLTLIEACSQLKKRGVAFNLVCAGAFESDTFKKHVVELVESRDLTESTRFPGMLVGETKCQAFRESAVFCFPSHYYAESFGIVLIEAMSFGLPVVATRWRGIPDVVGKSGGAFIVEPKRPDLVAERLEALLRDGGLRAVMGRRNREWFCAHYTLEQYKLKMERALLELGYQ